MTLSRDMQSLRLRVEGHVGGDFSVPPRTVRTLLVLVGSLSGSSPVWDRVWVTLFLASAMIVSHAFAAGGPPSPCSVYIYVYTLMSPPRW